MNGGWLDERDRAIGRDQYRCAGCEERKAEKIFGPGHLGPLPGDVFPQARATRRRQSRCRSLFRTVLCLSAGNYGLLGRERQFELVRNTAVGQRKTTVFGQVSLLNRAKMG